MNNPVLVEVLRGARVESRHSGAVAVMDADGGKVLALGDVAQPVYPRSAVKALQALPLIETGAADRYGVGEALREELTRTGAGSLPDGVPSGAVAKAWRFVGEMEEAAAALAAVDVPEGFSTAAAEVYRRLAAADPTDRANEWGLRGTAS